MSTASKLPNGWIETTFGEVVSAVSVNDKKLPKGQYLESGRFPVVDQGQQFIGGYSDDEARVISEDLPLLVFGDHTRAFKYLNQPFVPGADGVKVLKPIGVDAKWLYEIAHALEFPDKGYARHYQHLKSAKLFVPPLTEQRRIVAEIEKQFTRLEAGVAALRRVQANLKRYRAAVLKAACEGRLVPIEAELAKTGNRKAKFETGEALLANILKEHRHKRGGKGERKEAIFPDTRNLPPLTEGWAWASIGQLADDTMIGLDRGRAQQSDDAASGVPYIKMNNVTMDGQVLSEKLVYVPATREEADRFAVQDGDILFNTRNSKELVGKVGLVRNLPAGAIYNNNLMRIRLAGGVSPAFLVLQMCSHEFRRRMELVKKATTNVAAVYAKDLLPLAIALPPVDEQTRIVEEVERRLSVVEELEAAVSANLQRATRLRQSILHKAFTGGLT